MLYTKTTSGPRHCCRSHICSGRQPDAPKQTGLEKYFYPVTRVQTDSSIFPFVTTLEPWKSAHYLSFWKQREAPQLPLKAEDNSSGSPESKSFSLRAHHQKKKKRDIKLISEEAKLKGNSLDTYSKLKFHSLQNSKGGGNMPLNHYQYSSCSQWYLHRGSSIPWKDLLSW